MSNIERLKQLVLDGGFDADSKKQVSELEDRLHKAVIAEELKNNPVIKDYVEYLDTEISRCSYLLSEDDDLSEKDRCKLSAKREVARQFHSLFTTEKEAVEEQINLLVDVASSNQ